MHDMQSKKLIPFLVAVTLLGCSADDNEVTGSDLSNANDSSGDIHSPDILAPEEDSNDTLKNDVAIEDISTGSEETTSDVTPIAPLSGALEHCAQGMAAPEWLAVDKNTFTATCKNVSLAVTAYDSTILRLRYLGKKPVPAPDRSYAVVAAPVDNPEFLTVGTESGARICTPALSIEISQDTCKITIKDDNDAVLASDGKSGGYFEGIGAGFDAQSWGVGVRRQIGPTEHFYGFGERNGSLDKRGAKMHFWNSDVPGYGPQQDPLYQSIPFFVGLRDNTAYGVLTDNTYRMVADMGASIPNQYFLAAQGGEIDQYVIAGPTIKEVITRYTHLTGRMQLPPLWSLGYHQARHGYYPDTMVTDIADGLRKHKFPADAIWLDIDYMDEFRVWTWSPTDFPDPKGLIKSLRDQGLRTVVIIDPGVKVDDDWSVYTDGLKANYYLNNPAGDPFIGVVWPGDSTYPDFTNPDARSWWADLVPTMTDVGVEGLWTDMNEPANFDAANSWTVPNNVTAHGDGTPSTMAEMHNVYGSAMAWATHAGMEKHLDNKRPFVLTRAGYAGIQRYSAVWTGDIPSTWPAISTTLPMLLNMGLSGVSFSGSDVGGWMGGVTPELFTRWMQLGVFSPFYRNHTQKQTENQEPWMFGKEVEDITRSAVELRYQLLPYLYTVFEESVRTGAPILRPMVYEYQEDLAMRTLDTQAMLGSSLLVAPVMEAGAEVKTVHIPKGRWFEYHSGKVYDGPTVTSIPVRLAAMPILVRSGSVIPKQQVMQWTNQAPIDPLFLDVYPGAEPSTFETYEDDGETLDYKKGLWCRRSYDLEQTPVGARLTISARKGDYTPPARTLLVRVRRVDTAPTVVRLNGEDMSSLSEKEYDTLLAQGSGWLYDSRDRSVVIAFPDTAEKSVLDVEYDLALLAEADMVPIHFKVTAPEGTDTTQPLYIALSSNDWAHEALEWSDKTARIAEGYIAVPRGAWVDYKYTRGSWDTVEKHADCSDIDNRSWIGAAHPTRQDTVAAWANNCK